MVRDGSGLRDVQTSRPKLFPLLHLSAASPACRLRPGVKGAAGRRSSGLWLPGPWLLNGSRQLCPALRAAFEFISNEAPFGENYNHLFGR